MRAPPFDGQASRKPLTITVSDVGPDTILCELRGEIDVAVVVGSNLPHDL